MTQNEKILDHLTKGPGFSVTAQQAARAWNVWRLSGRVCELRKQGHNITTEMVTNGRVRYARYRLVK